MNHDIKPEIVGDTYTPEQGDICFYKELGGTQWRLCKVIAIYEQKAWIHYYYTGSTPVVRMDLVEFRKK